MCIPIPTYWEKYHLERICYQNSSYLKFLLCSFFLEKLFKQKYKKMSSYIIFYDSDDMGDDFGCTFSKYTRKVKLQISKINLQILTIEDI